MTRLQNSFRKKGSSLQEERWPNTANSWGSPLHDSERKSDMDMTQTHATTIIGLRRDGKAALGGDGQVTLGTTIMKHHSNKIRRVYNDSVLVGFAGAAADRKSTRLNSSHGYI